MSLKRSLVRKRSEGEKEIYRGLSVRESGHGALGDPILRQSTLVLLSVTALALSPRRRRGVNSYATRYLHYHISDAICSRELMHPRYFLPPRILPGAKRRIRALQLPSIPHRRRGPSLIPKETAFFSHIVTKDRLLIFNKVASSHWHHWE